MISEFLLNARDITGLPDGAIVAIVAFTGLIVGFIWLRRITGGDEDPDRSFYRYQGRPGGGSWIPGTPELPTWRWVVTRLALVLGRASLMLAVILWVAQPMGPFAGTMTWLPWAVGFSGLVIGNVWLTRIARRSPEDGAPPTWRYRD